MITLHTARDPIVPLWHETTFAGLAAGAGAADLLIQRTYDGSTTATSPSRSRWTR